MANATEMKSRLIDLSGSESTPRLTVEHMSGDITIQTWDRAQVQVELADADDGDVEDAFIIRVEDGHVYVGNGLRGRGYARDEWHQQWREQGRMLGQQVEEALRQGDFSAIGEQVSRLFSGLPGMRADADVRITVPQHCDVAVRTISGEVRLNGVDGNIYLESASGDLHMSDAGGTLLVKTASGDFHATGFSGRMGVRTASGDVHLAGGQLQAFNIGTVSGDIQLAGSLAPDGEYAIRTTSGDATLALPANTACTVRVRTVSGDVECDLPFTRTREGRRHASLEINGGGPVVEFGSISGDLHIRPADPATYGADGDAAGDDPDYTRRLRRNDAPPTNSEGQGDSFRVAGTTGGRATGPLADSPQPRASAEMAILEAIERGELSVDEGLKRLGEL